jgi:hypothetical protein
MPNRRHHLLIDDQMIDRVVGAHVVLGEVTKEPKGALLIEDKPWEVRFDNLYANVLYSPNDGVFKAWYNPFIIDPETTDSTPEQRAAKPYQPREDEREMCLCYATSTDGFEWEKPALGRVALGGSDENNLVMCRVHGVGVRREYDPNVPNYLAFMRRGAATSDDGLEWSAYPCADIGAQGDTPNAVLFLRADG